MRIPNQKGKEKRPSTQGAPGHLAKPAKTGAAQVCRRTLAVIGVLLLSLVLLCYGALWVICRGPSPSARDLFVMSCMETSFARLFPPLVLSEREIAAIQQANAVIPTEEVTDTGADFSAPAEEGDVPEEEILEVSGPTYQGKLLVIRDPARVVVGTPPAYGEGALGMRLDEMLSATGAVAGINAGGFEDENGTGTGGVPLGIVIREGKLLYGGMDAASVVVGFDRKNVLHVGSMTARQALAKDMRDAVSFGPVLVVNGEPVKFLGSSGGVNPRSAIGQREDGAVLLLAIDGRQPHSMGATYKDLAELLVEHGAVNAANLDGGSSSMLYYNGELVNTCSSLYGPRRIPSAFLVTEK